MDDIKNDISFDIMKAQSKKREYTSIEKGFLADAFKKSVQTIERWIKDEDPILTSDLAKEALAKAKASGNGK